MKKLLVFVLVLSVALIAINGVNAYAAKHVYVSNSGNNTVSVIDPEKKEIINTFRVGTWPAGMASDMANKKLYVVNSSEADSTVTVIDLESSSEVARFKTGIGPMAMTIDSKAGIGYVADTEHFVDGKNLSHTVSVVDLKTNKVIETIDVGGGPFDLRIVNDKLITSNSAEWKLAAISLKDRKVVHKAAVIDTPLGLGVSPDNKKVYVAIHGKGSVQVFDSNDLKELSTIKVGKSAWYIGVDTAKSKAYVTKREENAIAVIDMKTDKVIGNIEAGKGPIGIAVDSEAGRAYVVNHEDVSLSIIDTASDKIIGTVKLTPATESTYSGSPWGVAVY